MYQAESVNVVLKLSIVLADAFKFLLFLTVTNVSSETAPLDTVSKLNVPAPSVTSAWPEVPSAVGRLNVVPPEVIITLLPSDAIDSLASCNCSVGVPPESVNNNPVSCT